jgi:hypothetical protein
MIDDRRYIVCRNEDQAKKDAADRAAITSALKEKLKQGDKALVGNKGYRKYIQTQGERFILDETKIKAEAKPSDKGVALKRPSAYDPAI